jgi:hypothetical protein
VAECLDDFGNAYIKVGKANNPQARLANLQVGCPHAISRMSYFRLDSEKLALVAEKRIHVALKRYRLRGEWFVVRAGDDGARLAVSAAPAEVVSSVLKRPAITRSIDFGVQQALVRRYTSLLPHAIE